jgi:hypothetical protein
MKSSSMAQLKSVAKQESDEMLVIVQINRSKKIEKDAQMKQLSKVVNELLREQKSLKSKLQ